MVHQPLHPYQTEGGWVDYHRQVAAAVPGMGVVPYIRDTRIDARRLRQLARDCPNLVGIKYAVPNPVNFTKLVTETADLDITWICGLAERWAPFFWLGGATGFTSGLAAVAPELAWGLMSALKAGDIGGAMTLWRSMEPFEALRNQDDAAFNVSVIKDALSQLGLTGSGVRPPASPVSSGMRSQIRGLLIDWGLIDSSSLPTAAVS